MIPHHDNGQPDGAIHDQPKTNPQGERFVALARKVEIALPDEVFERKFDQVTLARATLPTRRLAPRVTR